MVNFISFNIQFPNFFTVYKVMFLRALLLVIGISVTSIVLSQRISAHRNTLISNFYLAGTEQLHLNSFFCRQTDRLPEPEIALFFETSGIIPLSTKVNYFTSARADSSDRDGDGIVDSLDKCPDEKGVIQYDGCPVPDSDNDGVADDMDECPTIAGTVQHKGCLPGDKDGDKINDDEDKCPDLPGVARYDGCPVKDTDGDGVDDDDDKCINIAGSLLNFGCPEDKAGRSSAKKEKKKKVVTN